MSDPLESIHHRLVLDAGARLHRDDDGRAHIHLPLPGETFNSDPALMDEIAACDSMLAACKRARKYL
jgi:hypothetical protein